MFIGNRSLLMFFTTNNNIIYLIIILSAIVNNISNIIKEYFILIDRLIYRNSSTWFIDIFIIDTHFIFTFKTGHSFIEHIESIFSWFQLIYLLLMHIFIINSFIFIVTHFTFALLNVLHNVCELLSWHVVDVSFSIHLFKLILFLMRKKTEYN